LSGSAALRDGSFSGRTEISSSDVAVAVIDDTGRFYFVVAKHVLTAAK